MHAIELKTITKKYPGAEKAAVSNLCLTVEKGEIVTLLGPSGCGKSTTLRMIAGFKKADKGSITLAGNIMSSSNTWIPPERRGVGMVFQDYALFPHLNVFNNVGFGYKDRDRKERIAEIIELVNLKGYEKRYPHQLSGGQQQRVALARALARKPVVILLDEPFSSLDADLRNHMRLEVKRIIKESGATAIFVSHDQKDALAISDSIVVMNHGIIQQKGTPQEIYQYPRNKFVATFVGQTNILKGKTGEDKYSVITALGAIRRTQPHGLKPGEEVYVSIRPDSLEVNHEGQIKGYIKELTYTGQSIDAVVEVIADDNTKLHLLTHIHPQEHKKVGEPVRLEIIPHFISVMPSCA